MFGFLPLLSHLAHGFNQSPYPSYALIVWCTSWHIKTVLGIVKRLTLAIFVAYGEWVNLVMVSA